jgi:hypothetical protein
MTKSNAYFAFRSGKRAITARDLVANNIAKEKNRLA